MLITFTCKAYENITMFGDVAKKLLIMMSHSATVPGAIAAKDVPSALSRLQTAIAQEPSRVELEDSDDEDPPISLAHRAVPLIGMLKAAIEHKCSIMWE